jgi:6-phosphogluconate dehydrogenase (decarboxylating)
MRRPPSFLGRRAKKFESVIGGENRALDNFRNLARAVAIGTDHFLHDGWIHPHPVGFGHRCSCD